MSTYFFKPAHFSRQWYIVDADGLVLGRLAALLAVRLKGKHKSYYTDYMDCGDKIVVINCAKVHLTGNKITDKRYYRHTGYPGAIKEKSPRDILSGPNPTELVYKAVRGMLSAGPLRNQLMKNLYLYSGSEHSHSAQKPQVLDVVSFNRKNVR